MRSKLSLLALLLVSAALSAAPSAPPAALPTLEEVIFNVSHLKQTLGSKMMISPIDSQSDVPAGVMEAIKSVQLDEICELSLLPAGATPLKRQRMIAPKFPEAQRRQKTDGRVAFLVSVAADGSVVGLYCYEASDRAFAIAAAQAMLSWKFKPATINKAAIPVLTAQLFEFGSR
jgi:TonB family protein